MVRPNTPVSVALVVGLLVGVTACATPAADAGAVPARGSYTAEEVRSEAMRVYESFAGTKYEQEAGEVMRAYAVNGPMDECLEGRGFPEWDWSLSRGYAYPYDPLTSTEWFADLGRRTFSEREIVARDYLAAEAVMNSDGGRSAQYEEAIDECNATTLRGSEKEVAAAGQPAGAQQLIEAWWTTMSKAGVEIGGNLDDYYSCMDAAKIPVLEAAGRGYDEIAQVMTSQVAPAPEPGTDPASYSDDWKHFLAIEDTVIAADVACRADVYERGISAMGPIIAEFERAYAHEIVGIQAGWNDIVERAEAFGYTGEPGPLGK